MKAKIFEIKRFAVHDGDGIRTTLFFKGCPLKCVWCHNPEGFSFQKELAYYAHNCISCGECISVCPSNAHYMTNGRHEFDRDKCIACGKCVDRCLGKALQFYGKSMSVKELMVVILKDKDFYDHSGGGVTLSGGECLTQIDFCVELLKALKVEGIHTAVDTSGFVPTETLDKVIPYTDIFLYDIKAFSEENHIRCTTQSNNIILHNLRYLDDKGCHIEVRIPYVPHYNDCEMEEIGTLLYSLKNVSKIRVLPYHNYAGSKYTSLGLENALPLTLPSNEEILCMKSRLQAIVGEKIVVL